MSEPTSQDDDIQRVRDAIHNPGRRPDIHRQQLARLRSEWPTLYDAIMHLIRE